MARRGLVTLLVAASLGGGAAGAAPVRDVGEALGLPQSAVTWSVRAGDLTGDEATGLVVSYHSHIRVYRNDDGELTEVLHPEDIGDPHGCAIADLNRDGRGDVYCARGAELGTVSKTNGLWLQEPGGGFSANVAASFGLDDPLGRGRHVAVLDLDRDGFQDLFVGNARDRRDGRPSPNRTYRSVGGASFEEVRVGVTREVGLECVQPVDVDRDGWTDLLVCGRRRVFLHRNVPAPGGGRRLRNVAGEVGLGRRTDVRSAWIADLDGRGRGDIVLLRRRRVLVLLWRNGAFRRQTLHRELKQGVWVAVGDVDGRRGPDLYVVQGCRGDRNLGDRLLLNDGRGRFRRVPIPQARSGCGNAAAMVDLDGDGRDEVVVLNGGGVWRRVVGPVQVLTMSPVRPPVEPRRLRA